MNWNYSEMAEKIKARFGVEFTSCELAYLREAPAVPQVAGGANVYTVVKGKLLLVVQLFSNGEYALYGVELS